MQLDKNERSMFLSDLGLSRSGLESLVSFESFESLRVALLMPNSDQSNICAVGSSNIFHHWQERNQSVDHKGSFYSCPLKTFISCFSSVALLPPKLLASFIRTLSVALSSNMAMSIRFCGNSVNRCETVGFDDFVTCKGYTVAKVSELHISYRSSSERYQERGLWRLEGKEYVVNEGDVLLFKFNVQLLISKYICQIVQRFKSILYFTFCRCLFATISSHVLTICASAFSISVRINIYLSRV